MTDLNPHVSKLFVYPVKSLDSINCDRVTILESGALKGDRTWAICDLQGNFVNGKRNAKVHSLRCRSSSGAVRPSDWALSAALASRSQFNLNSNNLKLQIQGTNIAEYNLIEQQTELCDWLADYFGFPVKLEQNLDMGFPDDTVSPGATIVSTATLEAIASWYLELDVADIRRRFRANIELAGVPAFWEDNLFTTADSTVEFKIGEVEFMGVNPCQRCIVVTRDPQTGKAYPKFQKTFITQRKNTLPESVERSRFNHYFRLAVNTRLSPSEAGKVIQIGDPITL